MSIQSEVQELTTQLDALSTELSENGTRASKNCIIIEKWLTAAHSCHIFKCDPLLEKTINSIEDDTDILPHLNNWAKVTLNWDPYKEVGAEVLSRYGRDRDKGWLDRELISTNCTLYELFSQRLSFWLKQKYYIYTDDSLINARIALLERLQVDVSGNKVVLDGKTFNVPPNAALVFDECRKNWPAPIQLNQLEGTGDIRADRIKKEVEAPLGKLLTSVKQGTAIKLD